MALLHLKDKSKKQVPQLWSNEFKLSTMHTLSGLGWGGKDIKIGDEIFGTLKVEMQSYIDGKDCNRSTLWNGSIPDGLVCGLNEEQEASCIGTLSGATPQCCICGKDTCKKWSALWRLPHSSG